MFLPKQRMWLCALIILLKDTAESKRYLEQLSFHRRAVALPEEVTLFVNDDRIEVIGDRPYYLFEDGVMKQC